MYQRYSTAETALAEKIHRLTERYNEECARHGHSSREAVAALEELERELNEYVLGKSREGTGNGEA